MPEENEIQIRDGAGLPPVGTKFEACNRGDGNWRKAEMLFVGKEIGVMLLDTGPEYSFYVNEWEYRPLRTPEQIAEEARIAELNLMIGVIKDYPGGRHGVDHLTQLRIHEEVCIDLYDAGWRKQVAP